MTKCEIFLNFFNEITKDMTLPDEVKEFYNMLNSSKNKFESNKPAFTENGIAIIKYLQSTDISKPLKSKEIADGMGFSSKTVVGSMRKLITDGYVEKFGEKPSFYNLSEKGKNLKFE